MEPHGFPCGASAILTSTVLFVGAIIPVHAGPVCAQEIGISPGERIRVTLTDGAPYRDANGMETTAAEQGNEKRLVGVYQSLSAGAALVSGKVEGQGWRVPLSSVSMWEVSQGKKGNWRKGMLIGSALGLAGALIEEASGGDGGCDPSQDWCGSGWDSSGDVSVLGSMILSGLVGAGIGAVIRTEGWAEVDGPVAQPRLSVGPRGGVNLGVSIATGK
jgi:hypothetical protein